MSKKTTFILVLALWAAIPSRGNANCSCWTSVGGRSTGSLCKLYTEGYYTHPECLGVCKFAGENGYAYIDDPAFNACKETFPETAKVHCSVKK